MKMKVILDRVPYCLQKHLRNEESRPKAAIIACLKMAMDHVAAGRSVPSVDALFEECMAIQQNMVENGWWTEKSAASGLLHYAVMWTAHNHGVPARLGEYKSKCMEIDYLGTPHFSPSGYEKDMERFGLEEIRDSIASNRPVIVSIYQGFAGQGHSTSILLNGFRGCEKITNGFFYRDPSSLDEFPSDEESCFISLSCFLETWRRTAIFIQPDR